MAANQIVLTAWDGEFLSGAQPEVRSVLAELTEKGVPVIAFTGSDRAELEPIRQQLNWTDPFITESGSGIFTPVDHNPFSEPLGEQDGGYYVQDLGCPYVQARAGLRVLANVISHPLKGFGDFTVPQLQKFLGITEDAAHRAKAREFSEPFMTPKAVEASLLVKAAEEMGFGVVLSAPEENRFSQLTGAQADVSLAVGQIVDAYRTALAEGKTLRILGLNPRAEALSEVFWDSLPVTDASVEWTTHAVADVEEWAKAIGDWVQ